jgi:hypothetical protein
LRGALATWQSREKHTLRYEFGVQSNPEKNKTSMSLRVAAFAPLSWAREEKIKPLCHCGGALATWQSIINNKNFK